MRKYLVLLLEMNMWTYALINVIESQFGKKRWGVRNMAKKDTVQHYLAEGLVALLPVYGDERGGTQVVTLQGAHHDPRSLPWLVEVLARFYRLDLAALRRNTGRLLELRHHIPLPLAEGLVLLPVKVRQAAALGEHTTGYVNLPQVEYVEAVGGANGASGETTEMNGGISAGAAPSPGAASSARAASSSGIAPASVAASGGQPLYVAGDTSLIRSRIVCRGGVVICCLNMASTVKAKLLQGERARQELLQRQKLTSAPAAPFAGLKGDELRELLPPCDCLLRNIFLLLLEGASRREPQQREQAGATAAPPGLTCAAKKE